MANNAIQLNGSTQYGKILNYAALDGLTDFTIESWYEQAAGGQPYSVAVNISDFAAYSTENGTPSDGVNFGVLYSGSPEADGFTSGGVFTVATKVHIAMVHNATEKRTRIYKNGVEIGYNLNQIGSGTILSPSGEDVFLGVNSALAGFFTGNIGGFLRIWNTRRTPTQLLANKDYNLDSAKETGLIVNCKFLEGTGATIDNEVAGSNDLILSGSPSWVTGPTITQKYYHNKADYLYKQVITIDHTKVMGSSNLSSFPALINFTDANLKTIANGGHVANSNGYDIVFSADADGTTLLDFEIERYDATTGEVIAWVRIPTLDYNDNTILYLFYGNALAINTVSNPTGVWDANYMGVYHLPNGTTKNGADSTSNGRNGTFTGTSAVTGQIDGAVNFTASGDRLTFSSISLSGVVYTISAWIKTPIAAVSDGFNTLFRGPLAGGDHQILVRNSDNKLGGYDNAGAGGFKDSGFVVTTLSAGWHYLVGVTNTTDTFVYIDGILVGTIPWKSSGAIDVIGNYYGSGLQQWGYADEVRISTGVARSADWILTEYNNQSSPSTFYSISGEISTTVNAVFHGINF